MPQLKHGTRRAEAHNVGRISFFSAVLVFVLVLVLVGLSMSSIGRINANLDQIANYPFQAVERTGSLRVLSEQASLIMTRFPFINTPDVMEDVRQQVDEIYDQMDPLLEEIADAYLGPAADLDALRAQLDLIHAAQNEMMDYAAADDRSAQEIDDYQSVHLDPLQAQLDACMDTILSASHDSFLNLWAGSTTTYRFFVTAAIFLTVVVAVSLVCYNLLISRLNRTVRQKNDLFDLLCRTVDQVFVISCPSDPTQDYISQNCRAAFCLDDRETGGDIDRILDQIRQGIRPQDLPAFLDPPESEGRNYYNSAFRYENSRTNGERHFSFQIYRASLEGADYRFTVLTDETQALEVQRQLREAVEEARKASQAKGEFLSRMSHEIRTPMNGIIGMTTVALQHVGEPEKIADCLNKISLSSKHLLVLINDVLDMSKIESGKLELRHEPFDFNAFVESVSNVIAPQAADRGVDFQVVLRGMPDEAFAGDLLRLNQVTMNLLSNALKFTPKGGSVTLRITALSHTEETMWLRFEVIDTGAGIAEENFEKIFGVFEQENDSITARYGGTGLGLSISRRFVEMMGGHISLSSRLGHGSTFTVELPLARVSGAVETVLPASLKGVRALVVDDDQDSCEYACLLLERLGCRPDHVRTAVQALDTARTAVEVGEPFRLYLVDWKMPQMDGLDLVKKLRTQPWGKDATILMVSGYDTGDLSAPAKSAGADAVAAKPLFPNTLSQLLCRLMGSPLPAEETKPADLRGRRVLLVEDNPLNMEIALELLAPSGAALEQAENGQEAVDKFTASSIGWYDAILMDVQMPVMDGYQATGRIRALDRPDASGVVILAMTANAFSEDVQKSLAAGMDGHISKPIDMNEVIAKLSRLLDQREEARHSS